MSDLSADLSGSHNVSKTPEQTLQDTNAVHTINPYKETVETLVKTVGPNRALKFVSDQSKTYIDRDEWDQVISIWKNALGVMKNTVGERDPSTLTCMANLSATLASKGDWKDAEELGLKAFKMRRDVLGERHSYTVRCALNLAAIYQN